MSHDPRSAGSTELSPAERSYLLEWYACYSVTLAEDCDQPRVARLLRALSVDLAIEAAMLRRTSARVMLYRTGAAKPR